MKKTDNRLVVEGEAANSIFKASKDLGFPAGHILIESINHGLIPALKAMGKAASEWHPTASNKVATVAPAASVVVYPPQAAAVRRPGRPRATSLVAPGFKNTPGTQPTRGRPRTKPPEAVLEGDSSKPRRGRPPGSKNRPKGSEVSAGTHNGSDVTEV